MMTVLIELGQTRGFVLDDPVAGVLDNTEYTLGGLRFIDITDRVRDAQINRGKNRELDRFSAGNMQLRLNNQDRYFDPFNGSDIDPIPRVPIRLSVNGEVQFYGLVDDWDYSYDPGGISYAFVTASDELTVFARQFILDSGTATPQLSGARVNAVLDMFTVNWPTDRRQIDTGQSTLCVQDFDGTNALEYLQLIEKSEQGQLFMGKTGDLVFRSRGSAAPRTPSLVTFADDGTGIGYQRLQVNYGTEVMRNRAIVSGPLLQATADNSLSQVSFGIIQEELDVLCAPGRVLQDIADYTVARFGFPEYRFESMYVNLDSLDLSDQDDVRDLEIGDVISVKFTPNNLGNPIEKFAQIIGITNDIRVDRHDIILNLTSLDFTSLVLDDPVFGKLDEYVLGF
jgi:hypothetical protein